MWILLFTLIFLFTPTHSFAQEATPSSVIVAPTPTVDPIFAQFEQYKTDVKYNQDLYNQAYLDYTQKKQVYTKYGTLTTQQDKFEATKKVLIARNNLLRTYLTALRIDLDKYKQANPTDTDKYQIELSKWESWLNEQNSIVTSFNNDDDVKTWANTFSTKYITIQQSIYTALIVHRSNYKLISLSDIQTLVNDIKSSPNIMPENQDWMGNITIKSDLVTTTLKSAYDRSQIKQNTVRFNNFYTSANSDLNKANQYLRNMLTDLKSVVIKFSK